MTGVTQFALGTQAVCLDRPCGRLHRVVVDPATRVVTHLVIAPRHHPGFGRLVPLELVDDGGRQISLRCTRDQFERLDAAEETELRPAGMYESDQVLSWAAASVGMGDEGDFGAELAHLVIHDTVPPGEVDVRWGECVHATDGDVGRVQGLVVNPENHHVTHVLLQQGHLWGRKQVAVPVNLISSIQAGIQLRISKEQVAALTSPSAGHEPGAAAPALARHGER